MKMPPLSRQALPVLALASLLAAAPSAHAFCNLSDDVGNAPGSARVIPSTGYNAQHQIERRADVDYFVFTAVPGATYSFTISDVSVAGLDVCLRASDGSHIFDRENSSGAKSATTFSWTPSGVGGLLYLDVRSLGEATTGSYRFQMSANLPADNDNDMLPDNWEDGPWANGSLNRNPATGANSPNGTHHDRDGDGFTNYQELLMGTDPTDARSALLLTDVYKYAVTSTDSLPLPIGLSAHAAHEAYLEWPAKPSGSYEVSWIDGETDLLTVDPDSGWTVVESLTVTPGDLNQGGNSRRTTVEADGSALEYKLYRVRQFGIPAAP